MKFFLFLMFFTGVLFSQSPPPDMVKIPSAPFDMGIDSSDLPRLTQLGKDVPHMSPEHAREWFSDEIPRHTVSVAGFYMDKYEVTNEQFRAFVQATGYKARGNWEKYAGPGRENHPVVNVTWYDADAYAKWAGKRLPTEAEWEYAARGGRNEEWFPWGNEADGSHANWRYQGESFWDGIIRIMGLRSMGTREPGQYAPNGFGLYDMCGNVAEWCFDTYHGYTEKAEDSETTGKKVIRGGSWQTPNPVFLRITNRTAAAPDHFSNDLGFRCVKDLNN